MRMFSNLVRSTRLPVSIIFLAAALSGCGEKKDNQSATPNSQVVARIGDQVVTTQELETEFRWANIPNDRRRDPEIVKRVLGELVTRKYLLQRAQEAKLDREPTVLLDLLRAREQVLANAYSSRQVTSRSSSLTKADLDKFIEKNPAKFANQQIFAVEQITIPLSLKAQSAIDAVRSVSSLDEVDEKLTSMGIPHGRSAGTLNSAEIPDELLKSILNRGASDIFFARAGQNGVFLKIKSAEPHPVAGDAAVVLARQLLSMDIQKTESSMAGITAKMEAKYEGEFAKIMADQAAKEKGN